MRREPSKEIIVVDRLFVTLMISRQHEEEASIELAGI
jgi:hypothetical protein